MPLSYDLTTFQILGQTLSKFFVSILVQTMTPKGHFKINGPLVRHRRSFGESGFDFNSGMEEGLKARPLPPTPCQYLPTCFSSVGL